MYNFYRHIAIAFIKLLCLLIYSQNGLASANFESSEKIELKDGWQYALGILESSEIKEKVVIGSFAATDITKPLSELDKNSGGIGGLSFFREMRNLREISGDLGLELRADSAVRVLFGPKDGALVEVGSVGRISQSFKDHTPQIGNQLFRLKVKDNSPYILAIQIQNAHFRDAQVWQIPTISAYKDKKLQFSINYMTELGALGVVLILGLWYSFLYFYLKHDHISLWMAAFCFCAFIRFFSFSGNILYNLFPDPSLDLYTWQRQIELVAIAPLSVFFLHFVRRVFQIEEFGLFEAIHAGTVLLLTLAIMFLDASFLPYAIFPINILVVLGSFVGLIVLVKATLSKRRGARLLLVGGAVLFLTVINDVLVGFGIFGHSLFLSHIGVSALAFSLGQVVSLRYAITYHKVEQQTRELTSLNNTLLKNQDANKHLLSELKKLVYPHQVKRIRKGEWLENTMPTEKQNAVVICFDIQNSGKIGYTANRDFFEMLLRECHLIILENYDGTNLTADAFMLKELGDGFLCSVGFPFSGFKVPEVAAIELSERFIQVFNRVASLKFGPSRVFCSLGLAMGEVGGFFPAAGLKHYDLFGDTIVKATRYEAMRKAIFKGKELQRNIVIMQERVFDGLPREMQTDYKGFVLDQTKVRDDEDATKLYYKTSVYEDKKTA